MKFKVGDFVTVINNACVGYGEKLKVVRVIGNRYKLESEEKSKDNFVIAVVGWDEFELKPWEEHQAEFTFQEVISRIKPGEIYEPVNGLCITQTITMDYEKDIIIDFLPNKSFAVLTCTLFKLQEPKKKERIIKVEHGKGGKQYEFIEKYTLNPFITKGCMVECNTKYGNCYGRCVDIIFRELTEQEIKQYKECWRV